VTLYDQLGGEAAVSAAVQRFYVRVLADPLLAPFFKDVNIARLRSHQFAFLSQALGGPQTYSGLEMAQAHALLSIEQRHFDAVAGHLVETLRELAVPPNLIEQVVAAVAPLAKQIVNTAGASA
jgi:hemoglobin